MTEYSIKETEFKLRYHDLPGEQDPILFIHGLGCSGSFDYPEVAGSSYLSGHRRILVDLLGAGFSDRPEQYPYTVKAHAEVLAGLMRDLDLKNCIIYGHSLGGAVAIELATMCKEYVKHLILSESNLDPSGPNSLSKGISKYSQEDFCARGFDVLIQDSMLNGNAMWAASLRLWDARAVHGISVDAARGGESSWRQMFYGLTMNKSFIFGEHSLPDPDLQALKEQGIHTVVVKDVGHSMAWENPEAVAKAIIDCLPDSQ